MAETEGTETTTPAASATTTETPAATGGLTEEQVEALLKKVRQEEKDKLYPKIDTLSESVKTLQEALKVEQEEKERVRKEAEQETEKKRREGLSADQRMAESLKKIEEQLASEREARAALESQMKDDKRRELLAAYRVRKIQEAGTDIIPDLVKGSSEKEIDASLEIAKARYVEIANRLKDEIAQGVRKNMPGPTGPDSAAHEEAELQIDNIDDLNIDPRRYARDKDYRAEIDVKKKQVEEQIAQAYAKSMGR